MREQVVVGRFSMLKDESGVIEILAGFQFALREKDADLLLARFYAGVVLLLVHGARTVGAVTWLVILVFLKKVLN